MRRIKVLSKKKTTTNKLIICIYIYIYIYPANIQQLRTAIEEEWTNIPQATINNLIISMRDVLHCVRQMVVTPDTDWFSDPPPIQ